MRKSKNKKINTVFFTTPRDGYKEGKIWIKRKEEEEILSTYLEGQGISICIDGPTGTGKSSLAITMLKKEKINFMMIQITKNMKWKDFCRRLLNTQVNEVNSLNVALDTGIDKGLPLFKFHFGFSDQRSTRENIEYEELLLDRMTDYEICEILYQKKITLLIDDFERASDEIISNIGEMCKLLTQSFISFESKLIIVGTDDIYRRLRNFNKALDERVKELSLGTIKDTSHSWKFLLDGFDKLKLKHPASEFKQKLNNITEEDLKECRIACYNAADGLLKSLNELGIEIAMTATQNNRISKKSIIDCCRIYLEKKIGKYYVSYPTLSNCIKNNTYVFEIITYLYENGIGKIHKWEEIINSFDVSKDLEQIENAIVELIEIDFLTRTGFDGEVLFVTNPSLAHTLGVVLSNPDDFNVPRAFINDNKQLVIPFGSKKIDR